MYLRQPRVGRRTCEEEHVVEEAGDAEEPDKDEGGAVPGTPAKYVRIVRAPGGMSLSFTREAVQEKPGTRRGSEAENLSATVKTSTNSGNSGLAELPRGWRAAARRSGRSR